MKRHMAFGLALLAAVLLLPASDYDARYLNIAVTYELNEDGSWDMTCENQVRLNTYYAVNRALGETFIIYNPEFQNLEILKSETTMADGRKVPSPQNAFNEVLPYPAHGFTDFSGLREMVVTHTGLERGAIIDLKYRIHTNPGFLPVFSGCESLERSFPVDQYKLEIIVPSGSPVYFGTIGNDGKVRPEEVADGSKKRYVFEFTGLPPAVLEPSAPEGTGPRILFSRETDWNAALKLNIEKLSLPEPLKEKASELKAGCAALDEFLAELKKIAADEIVNCSLGIDMTGWYARPLDKVFHGSYGTALEKTLLLKAVLKEAGMDAEMLAISAGNELAAGIATPLQFDGFLLKINDGTHSYYLDPCREQQAFYPFTQQGREAWNLDRRALEKLPVLDPERNGVDVSGTVRIDAEEVSGVLKVNASGTFHRYEQAAADSAKFIQGVLNQFFPVSKVEVKKLLILTRHEIQAEVTFVGKWSDDIGAGGMSGVNGCRLPGLTEDLVVLEKRESPLEIEAPFHISMRLEIEPAADMKIEYVSPGFERKNSFGFFSRSHSIGKKGRLSFIEKCRIGKKVLTPEEYPRLREMLMPYFIPDFWMVFKKGK